jgi:uncharacterized protein
VILEGLVTTIDEQGGAHLAPMGPQVEADMRQFILRPFQTSTTFRNLGRAGEGVLHVTDDVRLLARAAIGQVRPLPDLLPASGVRGYRLADTCRWYSFRVASLDDRTERATLVAEVVASGRVRDFFGFNRAKHAVVEAAILATRTSLLAETDVANQFRHLKTLVEKTGGEQERAAFEMLEAHVWSAYAAQAQASNP